MPLIDDCNKTECIEGIIYDISLSADLIHANVNGNLHALIHQQLMNSLCRVYSKNADLYFDETFSEYVMPDIMIVCDYNAFRKGTNKYYGVPKLIVETLSPSTVKKDRTVKKDFYARKGITEYWIIDSKSKSIEVYYLIDDDYKLENVLMLQPDPEEEGYNAKTEIALREFPHITFLMEDIFDRVDME